MKMGPQSHKRRQDSSSSAGRFEPNIRAMGQTNKNMVPLVSWVYRWIGR